ncbi:alpha/beta fold hydrolase [Roseibium sp.]|uniref:alpha/beta fold hydrolase n=1 Tax=Roseibium sp. TaxID=1936156 RepID=UPI003BAFA38B
MKPIADRHVLIQNCRIAHGIRGEGAPVVLIHGTPSSSLIWRNVIPALVAGGYKVHVFDLLGYGLSERPWAPDIDTSVSGQVPILEALMEHWGLADCHLIAHDIGGGVAQQFCLKAADRVRSLTLIDVVSFDSWPSQRTQEQMQAGLDALIAAPAEEHRAHFREWLLSTVENKDRFKATSLDTFLDLLSNPVGQASLFQHQVRHYDPKHTSEAGRHLGKLAGLPVQIIWGENDNWQVVDWAYKLKSAIPGAELHVLPDCGHFAMEDQPEEIGKLLRSFLDRCAPASSGRIAALG